MLQFTGKARNHRVIIGLPLAAKAKGQDYLGQRGTDEYGEIILSEYQGRGERADGFPRNFEWAGGGWGVIYAFMDPEAGGSDGEACGDELPGNGL